MSCITCKKKRANFNYINKKPLYCKTCKSDDMIDVNNIKCINCKIHQPIYNIKSEKPLYCKTCKSDDMIDVKNIKCINCKIHQPIYNIKGEKPLYCKNCKNDDMIDVKNKKCITCNIKQCRFNYPNEKKGIYCADCSLNGMIDIFATKCIICNLHEPSFNLPNEKKPTHCNACKTDNMIDIKHNKCVVCNLVQPTFNYVSENKPTHCKKCALNNMVNVKHKKYMCIVCNKKRPSFNYSNKTKPEYCANCKLKNMVDLVSNKCKNNCTTCVNNNKYDGYCTFCFIHLFPNDERTINIKSKSKEMQVVCHIINLYNDFIYNKPFYVDLENGCCETKRRIDLRMLINNTMLCIEIDENQHKYYIKQDEEKRYNDLFMDFSGKYIFIRYNPDKYKCVNNKINNPHFNTRINILKETINNQIMRILNDENNDLIEIYHLYYDEN